MQKLEAQFMHSLTVARYYQDSNVVAAPGFIPAAAMLALPRCCSRTPAPCLKLQQPSS
jgi:hypothetical protein